MCGPGAPGRSARCRRPLPPPPTGLNSATTLKATDMSPDSPAGGPLRLQVAAPPTTAPSAVVRSAAQCGSYRALEGCIQAGACGAVPRFQTPPFTICTAAALARRSCAAHTAHTLCRGRRGAAPPSARPRRSCAVQGVVLRYWSLRERPGRGRRAVPQYRQPDAAVGTAAALTGRSCAAQGVVITVSSSRVVCRDEGDVRGRDDVDVQRPPRLPRVQWCAARPRAALPPHPPPPAPTKTSPPSRPHGVQSPLGTVTT
jgi:hypothetical protein